MNPGEKVFALNYRTPMQSDINPIRPFLKADSAFDKKYWINNKVFIGGATSAIFDTFGRNWQIVDTSFNMENLRR